MTGISLTLVLLSAVIHASWNYMSKMAHDTKGYLFVFLCSAFTIFIYSPVAIAIFVKDGITLRLIDLVYIAGTGIIHLLYYLSLQKGYETSDLSFAYPLARGSGPMLSCILAALLFQERPSLMAICGIILIGYGIIKIIGTQGGKNRQYSRNSIKYALLTGSLIAMYTLWDKYAMSVLLIHPIIYLWSSHIIRIAALAPHALFHRTQLVQAWRAHKREVLFVGTMGPFAYVLILFALKISPVSYIAPAREISILIGAIMGHHLLKEGYAGSRIVGAFSMFAGLVLLVLG